MKRKLIKQTTSFVISLPAKWIKRKNLKGGEELEVDEKGDDLLVSATRLAAEEKKQFRIDCSPYKRSELLRRINASYVLGYNSIKVVNIPTKLTYESDPNKKVDAMEQLKDVCSNFVGFELMNVEKDSMIMEEITIPSIDSFYNTVNKIFQIINQAIDCMIGEEYEHVIMAERNVNKFSGYALRMLKVFPEIKYTRHEHHIVSLLEYTSDGLEDLAKRLGKKKLSNTQKQMLADIKNIAERCRVLYTKFDDSKFSDIIIKLKHLENSFEKKKLDPIFNDIIPLVLEKLYNMTQVCLELNMLKKEELVS